MIWMIAVPAIIVTWAIAMVLVKLTSRGPVIYRSMRPGIGGAPFACFKFRTMYRDADDHQPALEEHNEASGALFKIRDDPRVTPVGKVLRRQVAEGFDQRQRGCPRGISCLRRLSVAQRQALAYRLVAFGENSAEASLTVSGGR